MKKCPRCKRTDNEAEFYIDTSFNPYKTRYCKECQRQYRSERYQLQRSEKQAKLTSSANKDSAAQKQQNRIVSVHFEGSFKVTKLSSV